MRKRLRLPARSVALAFLIRRHVSSEPTTSEYQDPLHLQSPLPNDLLRNLPQLPLQRHILGLVHRLANLSKRHEIRPFVDLALLPNDGRGESEERRPGALRRGQAEGGDEPAEEPVEVVEDFVWKMRESVRCGLGRAGGMYRWQRDRGGARQR